MFPTPTIIELSDQESLLANGLKTRKIIIERTGVVHNPLLPSTRVYWLGKEDEDAPDEMLFTFGTGPSMWLLLHRLDFPTVNRRQCVDELGPFMFSPSAAATLDEEPPCDWKFFSDISKDAIGAKFDLQTPVPITGPYIETPAQPGLSNLLFTASIYFTENDAAKTTTEGQYLVITEIGRNGETDGGLISLFQGRELSVNDISFI